MQTAALVCRAGVSAEAENRGRGGRVTAVGQWDNLMKDVQVKDLTPRLQIDSHLCSKMKYVRPRFCWLPSILSSQYLTQRSEQTLKLARMFE